MEDGCECLDLAKCIRVLRDFHLPRFRGHSMLKFTLMNVMAAGVRVQDVWQGPIISVATHDSVAYKMKEKNTMLRIPK